MSPRKLSEILDPERHNKKLRAAQRKLKGLRREQKRNETQRNNLWGLLKDDGFDQNEVKQRMILNRNKDLELESQVARVKDQLKNLQATRDNDLSLKEFINEKQAVLRQIAHGLTQLSKDAKKRLIESMLDSPIKLYPEYTKYHKKPFCTARLKTKVGLNVELLKEFLDSSKLLSDKDGTASPATPAPVASVQDPVGVKLVFHGTL